MHLVDLFKFHRTLIKRLGNNLGYDVFVTHLCVSDFLMGVYLAIVGVADRLYYGNYRWYEEEWKRSTACHAAGFLSLVSSEVGLYILNYVKACRPIVFCPTLPCIILISPPS